MRFFQGFQALHRLLRDPDDTKQAFVMLYSFDGPQMAWLKWRMRRSAAGRELLAERPNLLEYLGDRERLAALPDGSLGREYLRFIDRENIMSEGLASASQVFPTDDLDVRFLRDWCRDQHDLWHVLFGYQGDLIGEAALMGVCLSQLPNFGYGILLAAIYGSQGPFAADLEGIHKARRVVTTAIVRGARAPFLAALPWHELLDQQIIDLRQKLGIREPQPYIAVRNDEVKAIL